jgi:hypothetical protein
MDVPWRHFDDHALVLHAVIVGVGKDALGRVGDAVPQRSTLSAALRNAATRKALSPFSTRVFAFHTMPR